MNTDDVANTSIGEVPKGATMTKKRNILIGTASVAVAILAIGGGASASSKAMASDPPSQKASLTIVRMDGGDPVSCTFDDVDLPAPLAGLPGVPGESGQVTATGSASVGGGSGAAGAAGGKGIIVSVSANASSLPDGSTPAGVTVIGGMGGIAAPPKVAVGSDVRIAAMASPSDSSVILQGADGPVINGKAPRQGTADECAAMRKDLPVLPSDAIAIPASTPTS